MSLERTSRSEGRDASRGKCEGGGGKGCAGEGRCRSWAGKRLSDEAGERERSKVAVGAVCASCRPKGEGGKRGLAEEREERKGLVSSEFSEEGGKEKKVVKERKKNRKVYRRGWGGGAVRNKSKVWPGETGNVRKRKYNEK